MNNFCPWCKKPIKGRGNKKFCNASHKEMYNRQWRDVNMTEKCLQCEAPVPLGQKYCCDLCGKRYRYANQYSKPGYQVTERVKKECACGDYQHCMQCRNRERRAAFRQNRVPVYMLGALRTRTVNL